ncbi:hypothetical protein GOP47_0019304 [Adiantum capillus-veneris]|uniref:Protein kinase domain-containing protein n=1 Tax=Adiantum capillus-veneris TaxID=13818 RepID=A0A9D4UEZ9_ADICA|nr:hypothetical protein GOP47_0019304 [Adiantum capillus-veneris]
MDSLDRPVLWLPCSPLGSGSFGHVSLALNLCNRTLFAVKSALSTSPQELLALQNELHIVQSLHSPFIIHCLGAELNPSAHPGSQPSVRHLFLEYMEGGNLGGALKHSGGGELRIRHFTHSILQGLAYLHANGIVHCDIKSQNILIGSSGVKIADFGMARRLGEASQMDGNLRGTPLWMAPEVAVGEEPMPASDIWSLGCTVVEMLQGSPPWGHVSSLAAALFKVGCSSQIPPLPEAISAEAEDFLLKCLQRDPKARWTAGELLKHSFVCGLHETREEDDRNGAEKMCKQELLSPRSTLDFFHSDGESDWEDEFTMASQIVPMLCFPPCKTTPMVQDVSQGSNWIAVKRGKGWCEGRQMPFMQAGAGPQVITRGSEVSLAAAEFLRNRVKPTIIVG